MRFSKYNKVGRVVFYDLLCEFNGNFWVVTRTWGELGGKTKNRRNSFTDQTKAYKQVARYKKSVIGKGYKEQVHRGEDLAYRSDYWIRQCWEWYLKRSVEELPKAWPEDFILFVRELFARLYEEAEELDDPVPWAVILHGIAGLIHEWQSLRTKVLGDRWDAAEAAVYIGNELWEALPKQPKPGKGEQAGQQAAPGGGGLEQLANDPDRARKVLGAALRGALGQAARDSNTRQGLMGWSPDGVGHGKARDAEEKAALAQVLAKRPEVMSLAETLGRVRLIVSRVLRGPKEAPPELESVTTGADLARTLPAELVRLKHPKLRLDFFRRYLERATQVYKVKDDSSLGVGPFVCCVDTSGSMHGMPDRWAKSLALALAQLAREQHRKAAIITFDTEVRNTYDCSEGLTVGALAQLIDDFAGGGTSYEQPLDKARTMVKEWGGDRTDVVLITDGYCPVGQEWVKGWERWRNRTGVRCVCLLVGGGNDPDPRLFDVCLHADQIDEAAADQLTRAMLARRNR